MDLRHKCKNCKKPSGQHNSLTKTCPVKMLSSRQVNFYSPTSFFEPDPKWEPPKTTKFKI